MTEVVQPLIIWTLQRTGGTNLGKHLLNLTRYPVKHEPFNKPREYGFVTKEWLRDSDLLATATNIKEALDKPQSIKHCVEMVPPQVSECVADVSASRNFSNLFLFRENSLQRVLSMEYARRTKVWGPSHERPDETNDPAFDNPIDPEALFNHELMSLTRLNSIWLHLAASRARLHSISFEQIYEANFDDAGIALSKVLDFVGIPLCEEKLGIMLSNLRDVGNQKTRDRYVRFEGRKDLENKLLELPEFEFFTSTPISL